MVSKRKDGFHNLETFFYPIPLYDVLELIDAAQTSLTLKGLEIPGNIEDNIVLKAYNLIKEDIPALPPVHFYLLKNIPVGAGLGAGSANGAFALIALNKKFQLNLSEKQLINYALQLGSDCPFFIMNQPTYANGRGEKMQAASVNLSRYKILLVNPGIHISTSWAFKQLQPVPPSHHLQDLIVKPIEEWKDYIINDFEKVVCKVHPEIECIKNKMYEAGATFALMSGSGTTVFGLLEKEILPALTYSKNYFTKMIDLEYMPE